MEPDKRTDSTCYIIGWCLIGSVLIYYIFCRITGIGFLQFPYPCLFHVWTGYYCPGCGGTRAVYAFLHGHFLKSFVYHPVVLCTAVFGGWFMFSQTIERLSRGRCRIGMRFRSRYLWMVLALIVINFAVKNLALLLWHVDLLR